MARPTAELRLDARGLTLQRGAVTFFGGIDLSLSPGCSIGLIGASGAGKSSLARALVGLEAPLTGSLRFSGRELVGAGPRAWRELRARTQLVWQDPATALDPHRTILDSLNEARILAGRSPLRPEAPTIRSVLARVDLGDEVLLRSPRALSGGMRQRAALARALVTEPALLLLDEITSALDRPLAWEIVDLLRALREDGLGLLLITHDVSILPGLADDLLVLERGAIVERGPTRETLTGPRHAATQAIVAATPRLPRPAG